MSEEKEVPEYAKPALYVGTMIVSIVGLILVAVEGIGGWWEGGYNYWFAIDSGLAAPWGQLTHVPIVFGFLFIAYVALQKIYPVVKLSADTEEKIEKAGFWTAIGIVIFTVVNSIIFAIVRSYAEWWFEAGFYAGIFAGGLAALFIWLAKKID
ncbi:MAG: hypothetical protein ACFFDS_05520 [Candidatus Thorarchaeota archaeon]